MSQQDRDLVTLREQLDAAREAAGISTTTSSSHGKGKATTSSGAGGGAGARAKGKGTKGGAASSIAKLEARIDELQRELVGTRVRALLCVCRETAHTWADSPVYPHCQAERDSFRSQFRERLQEFIKIEMEAKTLKISSAVKDERIAIMEKVLAAAERYEWSEPWQCDVCTLMNQADAAQCSACNHPKPS